MVQFGHSLPARIATGRAFLPPADLAELMRSSDIVISHGGPATISEARMAGHVPLVLPRDPRLNEHIDDHQLRFARWSGEHNLVSSIGSVQDLQARVASLVESTAGTRGEGTASASPTEDTSRRLSLLLDQQRSGHWRPFTDGPAAILFGRHFGRRAGRASG